MEYGIKVDGKDHAFRGQQKMDRFRKEGRFCDFVLKVESRELPVHRNIISCHSDFFEAMVSLDMKEKQTGVGVINGVDGECAVKCVDFMYTGETSVMEDKCVDLMHAATMFQLTPLCDALADLLVKKLDCNSFFTTKELAVLFNNRKLTDICNEFALKHFSEIAQLEEFGQLDEEYIKFLILSENLKASEGAKCKSLINWAKHDSSARKTSLPGLLSILDLSKVPLSYRSYITECEAVVYSSIECMKIAVMSVFRSMKIKSRDMSLGFKMGLGVFDTFSQRLQVLDITERSWTPKQVFQQNLLGNDFSAVILEEHLYVFTRGKAVYRISHLDPDANWERRANKNQSYCVAVACNGFIYTSDWYTYSNRIERYCATSNRWDFIPYKQMNVAFASLAISEGKVFSIAGLDRQGRCRSEVEIFDPDSSGWKCDSPLKKGRRFASTATHEERIYVMGGTDASACVISDVEYRCPSSQTWIMLQSMKVSRSSFGSFCMDGKIYAIGGDQSNPKTIEEYDPETKEWEIIERMDGKNISAMASVCLPSRRKRKQVCSSSLPFEDGCVEAGQPQKKKDTSKVLKMSFDLFR